MRGVAAEASRQGYGTTCSGGVHGGAPHIHPVLGVLLTALLMLLLAPATGLAHTDLVSSDPSDGEGLRRPPKEVVLTFNQAPLGQGLAVRGAGVGGSFGLQPQLNGNRVVAAWPQTENSGQYRVSFRVVAEDGHPIEGSFTFRVAAPKRPSQSPTQAATPANETAASGGASSPGSLPPWLWVAGGAVLVFAIVMILTLGRRGDSDDGS